MRIRALKSFASKEIAPSSGQIVDCSDALGFELLDAGYAERVEEAEVCEVEAVATSQQDEPAEPTDNKAKTKKQTKAKKAEETKDDNKSGDKKRAVSTAKGKRSSSK